MRQRLTEEFYARHSTVVAPDLIGKLLVVGECSGRITEVEAYSGADDAASHAYRGRSSRNDVMFGPAGHIYVYFTYGMHFCANVVTDTVGVANAVLLRAIEPIDGIEQMVDRRGRSDNLTNGPGKLCQALGLDRSDDGASLLTGEIGIYDDGWPDRSVGRAIVVSPRIGITRAVDFPWRWQLAAERVERKQRVERRRPGGSRTP